MWKYTPSPSAPFCSVTVNSEPSCRALATAAASPDWKTEAPWSGPGRKPFSRSPLMDSARYRVGAPLPLPAPPEIISVRTVRSETTGAASSMSVSMDSLSYTQYRLVHLMVKRPLSSTPISMGPAPVLAGLMSMFMRGSPWHRAKSSCTIWKESPPDVVREADTSARRVLSMACCSVCLHWCCSTPCTTCATCSPSVFTPFTMKVSLFTSLRT